VDLDVLQIRILASLQASIFAEFLYMHGTNVFKFGSAGENVKYVVRINQGPCRICSIW